MVDAANITREHLESINVIGSLVRILEKHRLGEFYPTELLKANFQLQKANDLSSIARQEVINELRRNIVTFEQHEATKGYGSSYEARNPWEFQHRKYIRGIISAIRIYRDLTGASLIDAKIAVEAIRDEVYTGKIIL
jgi:ribosomal protein L7/L12